MSGGETIWIFRGNPCIPRFFDGIQCKVWDCLTVSHDINDLQHEAMQYHI